ncbi:hypothetical protein FG386_000107 [Cryptosporidium ryanae]|uniref:uncharacterized protein n=1 Tax=Cryptosporidium ryanae TaxID=515981 RepID=UPI00351A7B00|nr:hypothetical protein FG386_000107 [Cryptosporidium ryanae]
MEIREKVLKLNNVSNNNLILQKLRNNSKNQCDNGNRNKSDYRHSREIKHCNYNDKDNELFKFKLSLGKSSQEYAKLNKENAKYKFVLTSYSYMLITLLKLRYGCNLEDIKTQLMRFRQLNYIFLNCEHFSSMLENGRKKTKNNSALKCIDNDSNVKVNEKRDLINEKIENLNTAIDHLKESMKNYLVNSIKQNHNDSNINISIRVINCENLRYNESENASECLSEDSTGNLHEYCGGESAEKEGEHGKTETESVNDNKLECLNKNKSRSKKHNKITLQHRRYRETISYGGTSILINSPNDYSPAPKYHSRFKTQSTRDESCGEFAVVNELVCGLGKGIGNAYYSHNINTILNNKKYNS